MTIKLKVTDTTSWQRKGLDVDAQGHDITDKVSGMLEQIRTQGDAEIDRLSIQFDGFTPRTISLKPFDDYHLPAELSESIKTAATRIERFSNFQKQQISSATFSDEYGSYSQIISPIQKVGAYIPAGRFPLISTALMTLIPAKVAGSPVRIACSPSANEALLAAASLAGATEFIQIGGVQAIASLAYGAQVDIVVGPGNVWVNEAKKQLQSIVKIDGLAGPSELLAICDADQPIEWLALDALAQAEHDPMAYSLITSDSKNWLEEMKHFLESDPRFTKLLQNQQIELIFGDSKQALIDFSEHYAPEHLMLCHNAISADELEQYGSLFIGANSAVALGDYISGPNHTLPTLGFARQTGGLSVNSFLKIKTMQSINDYGRKMLSEKAMPLAQAEGLTNHYESMKVRS